MKWPYQHKEDPYSIWNAPIPEINQWYETYERMQPKENPLDKF